MRAFGDRANNRLLPRGFGLLALFFATLALSGCTDQHLRVAPSPNSTGTTPAVSGTAMGGQQPIAGASVQMYAVGTTADGSASTPMLASPSVTDAHGNFSAGSYTCPTPATPVYLTAAGGNPGLAPGTINPRITLMVVLGPCESIADQTYVNVNEVTTVAAAYALAPYVESYQAIGSGPSDAALLADAFSLAAELANPASGQTPGVNVPAGQTIPASKLMTLADILSTCVNSAGGHAGDNSICGQMFSMTTSSAGAPDDTFQSMVNLALNSSQNVTAIYDLEPPNAPFQPALAIPPADWSLAPLSPTTEPVYSPGPGTYTHSTLVSISSATPSSIVYYTTDGSRPTSSSTPYTGALAVSSTSTIRAVAVAAGVSSLMVAGSYVLNSAPTQKLVFLTQPSSTLAGSPLSPAPSIAIEKSSGEIDTTSSAPVTLQLASNPGGAVLSGQITVNAVNGVATFSGLSINLPWSGYTLAASANGPSNIVSNAFPLTDAIALNLASTSVQIGTPLTGSFHLVAPAPPGGIPVTILSSDPANVSVSPAVVVIPTGQTQGTFTYTGATVGSATLSVSISNAPPASAEVTSAAPLIPGTYFGMSVQYFETTQPLVTYGTTRTWDAYYHYFNNTPGLDWPHISASRGVYNFTAVDDYIRINKAANRDIIYTFGLTPAWASSQPSNTSSPYGPGECAPPASMADWDAFVTAIATHAKGNIKYWELWNEPQDSYGYCGDIPTMVTMAQHAYQILKTIDPTNTVLSPAVTSNDGPAWLTSYFAEGGAAYTDVVAFHGYWSTTAEDINGVIANYQAIAKQYGLAAAPMWDTEASWAGRNGAVGGLTDPGLRAAFLAKYYLLHWSKNVSRFLWYAYDSDPQWGDLWDSTNGLHQDGVAYQQVYRWMVGASLTSPCVQDGKGNWACTLAKGAFTRIAVWNSGSATSYAVPSGFTQYQDLQGGVHPVTGGTVSVGNMPILLETGTLR